MVGPLEVFDLLEVVGAPTVERESLDSGIPSKSGMVIRVGFYLALKLRFMFLHSLN